MVSFDEIFYVRKTVELLLIEPMQYNFICVSCILCLARNLLN